MLAFQVLYGRGLRGVFPNVPQSNPPSTRAHLFCLGSRPAWQETLGRGCKGGDGSEGIRLLAVLSFQLTLCPCAGSWLQCWGSERGDPRAKSSLYFFKNWGCKTLPVRQVPSDSLHFPPLFPPLPLA